MRVFTSIVFLMLFLLSACQINLLSPQTNLPEPTLYVYTVMGNQQAILRVITSKNTCPEVQWSSGNKESMSLRVGKDRVAKRTTADEIDAKFDVTVCEIQWPKGVESAQVVNLFVQGPKPEIKRIVVIGDTGCRLKLSDQKFQDCNDSDKWPYAQVIRSAAMKSPDLVVHVGDYHYRESPCPKDKVGCQDSPWGYGFDTWESDVFLPSKPLMKFPWVFVRGNHESCARAGQGWFRYLSSVAWDIKKSCDDPKNNHLGDFEETYAVSLGDNAQLIIFDSSAMPGLNNKNSSIKEKYAQQIYQANQLGKLKPNSIFVNHHPFGGIVPDKELAPKEINTFLYQQLKESNSKALFTSPLLFTLHGHIHIFETVEYTHTKPVMIISGNSGSSLEEGDRKQLLLNEQLKTQLQVSELKFHKEFGFLTFDKLNDDGSQWLLTEYDVTGKSLFTCRISQYKSRCQ